MTAHIAGKPKGSSNWEITQALGFTKILTLRTGFKPNLKVGLRATNVGLRAP